MIPSGLRRPFGAAFLYALPFLALLPLGVALLWQRGWVVWWLVGAALCSLAGWALLRTAPKPAPVRPEPFTPARSDGLDPHWTPAERRAWETAVLPRAEAVDPASLTSLDAVRALASDTVAGVAAVLRPDADEALYAFTVPEGLALAARVAERMREALATKVPGAHHVTVRWLMRAYGWRPAIERSYALYKVVIALWRVVRPIVSPQTVVAAEMKALAADLLTESGGSLLTRQFARLFVREVGRAAIDLYGGRLATSAAERHAATSAATVAENARAPMPAEPLRLLVVGQSKAGKSSLVNALVGKEVATADVLPRDHGFQVHALAHDGITGARLVEAPGLPANVEGHDQLLAQAHHADMILWVAAADRPERARDRAVLDRLRAAMATDQRRTPAPMLLVLTGVDRLKPVAEWEPPYNVAEEIGDKAQTIRAAMDAAAADLGFGIGDIVPVCCAKGKAQFNVDTVWADLLRRLDPAKARNLDRRHAMVLDGRGFATVLQQAKAGGWYVGQIVLRRA